MTEKGSRSHFLHVSSMNSVASPLSLLDPTCPVLLSLKITHMDFPDSVPLAFHRVIHQGLVRAGLLCMLSLPAHSPLCSSFSTSHQVIAFIAFMAFSTQWFYLFIRCLFSLCALENTSFQGQSPAFLVPLCIFFCIQTSSWPGSTQ